MLNVKHVKYIFVLTVVLVVIAPTTNVFCLGFEHSFTGRIQTTYVVRDTSGFQYGFMDDLDSVQLRNELKFDLDIRPVYEKGKPTVRVEKLFLSYRGAYDAIFDLRSHAYENIREKSPDDFELGQDDIEWENDLREWFIDLKAEWGLTTIDWRLGRQIVQWGEADGFNLMNIVNPQDNRSLFFFDNPDDLATPIAMSRIDLTRRAVGPFRSMSLQFLVIPDIRPHVYAPLDGVYEAPYAFLFKPFAPLVIKEDVPSTSLDNMEYGVRLGANWADWNIYLYYFDGIQDDGQLDFTTALSGFLTYQHPYIKTYGASFNTWIDSLGIVLRGEASYTEDQIFLDFSHPSGRGFTEHNFYQALIGIDEQWDTPWLGTKQWLITAFQFYYAHVDDWDEDPVVRPGVPEDAKKFTLLLTNNYFHGRITPTLFFQYQTVGVWMTNASIDYIISNKWFCRWSQISFFGNTDALSGFAPLIRSSEMSLRIGYKF